MPPTGAMPPVLALALPRVDQQREAVAALHLGLLGAGPVHHRRAACPRRRRGRHGRRRRRAPPRQPPPSPLLPLLVAARLAPVPLPPPREVASPYARAPSRGLIGEGILPKIRLALLLAAELEPEDEHRMGVRVRRGVRRGRLARGEEPVVEVPGDLDAVAAAEVDPLAAAELPAQTPHVEHALAVDGDRHADVRAVLLPPRPVPAPAAGHEIHGDLPLLAPDGHERRVAAAAAGAGVAEVDVLPPREEHGARAAGRRAPGPGPAVGRVGEVPSREDHLAVDDDGDEEPRGGLGGPGAREPRAGEVPRQVDAAVAGAEPPGPAPVPEEPGADAEGEGLLLVGFVVEVASPEGRGGGGSGGGRRRRRQAEDGAEGEAERGAGPGERDEAEVGLVDGGREAGPRRGRGRRRAAEARRDRAGHERRAGRYEARRDETLMR
uniref:Uncharacterized protein n=1 Tax=Arundo donax TaxID=35708 RepID=A0A0A9CRA6_ARUDO